MSSSFCTRSSASSMHEHDGGLETSAKLDSLEVGVVLSSCLRLASSTTSKISLIRGRLVGDPGWLPR